jgi:ATP-dependent DNA helicase RecG
MKNVEEKAKKLKIENHLDERAASTNIDSLSVVALQKFLTESKKKYKPKSTEFLKELVEMDLLAYNEKSKTYLPTGNTILLFGKSPRNKFPQSSVKAKVHYGDGRIGTETFDDALVLIPDKVEDWLRKILPASLDRSKFKAQQIPSFPIEVVREAIINAIIHRDYSLDGAKVHLIVYPDKIVVKSPGKPIPPVTIESLKNFTATPYSRNKKLTFVFNEMDYMEETGVGMDTFRSQRPLPIYEYDGLNIVLTFPRILEAVKDVIHNEKIKILNNNELSSYDIFRNGKPLTKSEFVKQTGLPDRTAERLLKKFTDLKLLKKQGLGPSTNYIINE